MATRVNQYFNLGTNYQGRIYVTDSDNVSANTSSVRFRVYVKKITGTGYWNLNSSTRSWSVTGVSGASNGSGSSNYDYRTSSGVNPGDEVLIGDYTRTITHNVDGSYYDSSFNTSITHVDNPPGSGNMNNSLTLTNFPEPAAGSFSTTNIKPNSATISAAVSTNGNGTSTTLTFYYRKVGAGSWTSAGTGTSKDLTGLSANTDYEWYVKATNNTGNTSNSATQSFTTKPANNFFALMGDL